MQPSQHDPGSLRALAELDHQARASATAIATELVEKLRVAQQQKGGVDALLNEFSLSSEEGVSLMCLAEALLRVPDAETADKLIADKLEVGDWASHLGRSGSSFVNASAWALLFAGKTLHYSHQQQEDLLHVLQRVMGRLGQPMVRIAVRRAMEIMGEAFVMGPDIESAMGRAQAHKASGYRYSFDMLGEAARTKAAADNCFDRYLSAIEAIGARWPEATPEIAAGVSVKLSAICARYSFPHRADALRELVPSLTRLCLAARRHAMGLTVDAEEASRLGLSLEVIETVFRDSSLRGWSGFGVAVQAYQKSAPQVIDRLAKLAECAGSRIMVRLVKGAYWDSEIKHAQVHGLADYPVFTRKAETDLCYQACARKLLDYRGPLFPQFATHNAWAVAAIIAMDERRLGYEFQRLHGMGEALHDQLMRDYGVPCRIYAPVGEHKDLLAYLVRRLLENGANSSFVNNIVDPHVPLDSLIRDPSVVIEIEQDSTGAAIPVPPDLYGERRRNSYGLDMSDVDGLRLLEREMAGARERAVPCSGSIPCHNPAKLHEIVGRFDFDSSDEMRDKLARVQEAFDSGGAWPAKERAEFLERFSDALEDHRGELIRLCIVEAGKTLDDSIAELREAVDFCRYYAIQARELPPGRALGVTLCISPWNFPLAIFLGQIAGALAAGNAVLAKPAEQTPLIALRAIELMNACGLPKNRVQCLIARGQQAGELLVPDSRIKAALFTGSGQTGRWLFDTLLQRADAPVPLIAETGGLNAMIVDSTALPEQVVDDVIRSGFRSAGQRCSALRVLFVQEEIADELIEMIIGAMQLLTIGDPAELSTDVGPVIDDAARNRLSEHIEKMKADTDAKLHVQLPLPASASEGYYVAPCLIELKRLGQLRGEVFGPIVHVIRYSAFDLPTVIDQINATGFGLTLGIHTRVQQTADAISEGISVGNVYVNRDMVGAVVGVQPFGGRGLSGTGPKAGGPLYLRQLMRPEVSATDQATVPDLRPRSLNGPTGESNLYLLEPRGKVLGLYDESDDMQHCLATIDAALSTGNTLCLYLPDAWRDHLSTGQSSKTSRISFQPEFPDAGQMASFQVIVLAPGSRLLARTLPLLRGQPGLIPRLIVAPPNRYWHLDFVMEKVITTNTTAAGGNAALMSQVFKGSEPELSPRIGFIE